MKKIFIAGSSHFIDKNINKVTPTTDEADIETYFGDELNKADFFTFTNTASLFGNDKFAVIRNVAKISNIDDFIQSLAGVSETSLILSTETGGGKSESKIIKALKAIGFEIRQEDSFNKATKSDVMNIFKDKNIPISIVNANYILNISEGDMASVENEAEKLAIYLATNKNITADDAIKYITGEKEEKTYMVTKYFAQKNTKACLEAYKTIPKTYDNNMSIFFMITKFVSNMYYSYINPALSDTKTDFQRSLMDNKRLWKKDDIAELVGYVATLDFEIKTGRKSFENAIADVIIKTSIPHN